MARVVPTSDELAELTEEEVIAQEAWALDGNAETTDTAAGNAATSGPANTRVCHLNDPEANKASKFASNVMVTSKYSLLTFLPKNLFEQFRRMANVYFLTISCLQLFTDLSPTSKFTTAGPLAGVVMFSMFRELFEDLKRHKADSEVNNRLVLVLRRPADRPTDPLGWVSVAWSELIVGDIVKVVDRHEFPADLILLSSSMEQGACYIETCNLDGETNLKMRSSVDATNTYLSESDLETLKGSLEYEVPNNRLYNFLGKFLLEGRPNAVPLDVDNILLRGAVLRNTKYIHGLVIYTGKESKQMMNSSAAPSKRSNVEIVVNSLIFMILALELSLCAICTILMHVWVQGAQSNPHWYLPYVLTQTDATTAAGYLTFFILFNNFVPISLYVTMEFVKMFQAIMIGTDLEMYHEETDTPAAARTSNLNEELGQIEFIFSDKTGTLTRNEMEFRKCAIGGTVYGFGTTEIGEAAAARDSAFKLSSDTAGVVPDVHKAQVNFDPAFNFDDPRVLEHLHGGHESASTIEEFLTLLAVSHTVVPEGDPNHRESMIYQAESPDEQALVSAARCLGYFFCAKTSNTVTVEIKKPTGEKVDKQFEILAINKFNSTRKRMSVICRTEEGQIKLYVKGADNLIYDRLAAGQATREQLSKDLAHFGTEGLRTLVLAKRDLDEGTFAKWIEAYHAASTALVDRDGELERVAEEIEVDLEIVGATAIEDKLQVGVPDAIATLAQAGLKIWVLTGDKEETAINIGFACQLLTDDMQINVVNADVESKLQHQIDAALDKYSDLIGQETEHIALVIDGKALTIVMDNKELEAKFLTFARMSKAVIACRVSPKQKAEIVKLVRVNVEPAPMTLAIGDGANDVSMIQEAHVGIGISGNEGMQAVRSADYAIAQFRFLKRLLLYHGRCNYKRVSMVILYSFYKNCGLVMTLFFYCLFNGYSGSTLMDSIHSAAYNVIWTSLPIIVYGVLERDVEIDTMLKYPQLYQAGLQRLEFNAKKMGQWMLNAILHALLVYMFPCFIYYDHIIKGDGSSEAWTLFGTTVANILAIVVNVRLALEMSIWTKWHAIIVGLSLISFFILTAFVSSLSMFALYSTAGMLYPTTVFWLTFLADVALCASIDIAVKHIERTVFVTPANIIQERERLGLGDFTSAELGHAQGLPKQATPSVPQSSQNPPKANITSTAPVYAPEPASASVTQDAAGGANGNGDTVKDLGASGGTDLAASQSQVPVVVSNADD